MSFEHMKPAWQLDIPPSSKLVLISLADQADDDGYCFPSIQSLINRTGLSERAVQTHLNFLVSVRAISRKRRRHRTTLYLVHPERATCERVVWVKRADAPEFDMGWSDEDDDTTGRPADSAGLDVGAVAPAAQPQAGERAVEAETRPADSAGQGAAAGFETRRSARRDPQILRPDPAAAAPKSPVTPKDQTPIPRERARGGWGEFARLYPKKGKAGEARAIWGHLDPDDQDLALAVLRRQLQTPPWQGEQVQWLPTMARWLAERQFELYPDPRPAADAPAAVVPLTEAQRQAGSAAARAAKAALSGRAVA